VQVSIDPIICSSVAPSAAATEFRATLGALGLTHIARWFNVSQRSVRRWRDLSRPTPRGVALVLRLLAEGTITAAQVEQAAAISTPTISGSAAPEPLPPVEPEPKQSALTCAEVGAFAGLSPAAAAVVALAPGACRWPLGGDPQDHSFRFCNNPATKPPYCARHRSLAYLPPRTGSERGVRVGFVAHWRHGPTGAARAPKIPLDRAGALFGSAPPPA